MIFVEDNTIKLNGVVLPGLVKSIEVKESAQIDEQEVEGSATKPKQATGYEDAKVNIELILDDTPTQTKYQRLETLRAIFRTPGQSVPKPLSIVSEDTAAHGVDKVLFKGLTHKMENKSPSSRRAWIEISLSRMSVSCNPVALLAEGVDRNTRTLSYGPAILVALLAEGVDRNIWPSASNSAGRCRPPRGGRG